MKSDRQVYCLTDSDATICSRDNKRTLRDARQCCGRRVGRLRCLP